MSYSSISLYLKVRNFDGDQETEPYLFYHLKCFQGSEPLRPLMKADFIWKEDSHGARIMKDRYSGCLKWLDTEEEFKEFMWVKLRSQDYNGQLE